MQGEIQSLEEQTKDLRMELDNEKEANREGQRKISSMQGEIRSLEEKTKDLRIELDNEKEANRELRFMNNNLLKRNNLEFFLRAFYSIPFAMKISNQNFILKYLFDEIKINYKNNMNKKNSKKSDLQIRAMFKVDFGKVFVKSESKINENLTQEMQNASFIEKDFFFLANEDHLREIIFNLLKVCKENKCELINFHKTLDAKCSFPNENSCMWILIEKTKSLFPDLCEHIHVKNITPMDQLEMNNNVPLNLIPFGVLTDFYHPIQDQIIRSLSDEVCAD